MKFYKLIIFILNTIIPFKWWIVGQCFVGIIWAIDLSLRPYLIKTMLDRIGYLEQDTAIDLLFWPAIFYIFVSAFMVLVLRFYDYIWLNLNPSLRKYIGLKLMDRMMEHSHQLYQMHFSGSLANKINDVISGVPNIVRTCIDKFFNNALALVFATYTLYHVNQGFAIAFIIWVSLFIYGSFKLSKIANKYVKEIAEVRSKLTGYIVDILSNIINVRFFVGKRQEHNILSSAFDSFVFALQKRERFFMKSNLFHGVAFVLLQGFCLWWLIRGLNTKLITPGDFALVLALNGSIINCLWNLSHDIRDFNDNIGNLEQGLNIVLSPLELEDKTDAKNLIVKKGNITFENVYFNYKETPSLFENISLEIKQGEKIGLVGYSGSGKSTFVNLILRLFDTTKGRILIDKQDIREVTQSSLRKAISFIPQDVSLFHRSLKDNILYGKPTANDLDIIEAAKQAQAHEFISCFSKSYESLVGERGVMLSGGQRQRIAIARAILKDAPILILDEATSHLDSLTENYIQKALMNLIKGKTTLVIAHRLSTLKNMDRILVFDNGKIVEDGSHQELLEHSGLYKSLWDTQVKGILPKISKTGSE